MREHVVHERDEDVAVVKGGGGGGTAAEVLCMNPDQRARDGGIQLAAPQLRGVGHSDGQLPIDREAETASTRDQ
jgi:hypothetical protein